MNPIETARGHFRNGHVREALSSFDEARGGISGSADNLFRAELLALLGESEKARDLINRIEKTKHLAEREKSHKEFVRALVAIESGDLKAAHQCLQRSITHAERAEDLQRSSWGQMRLMMLVADRSGASSVTALLAKLRSDVSQAGDPL